MDTRFMNSKNRNTSNQHRLMIHLTKGTNSKRSDEYFGLLNLII